jgi:L-alanine-DL-glutamate epimerase-like enolase superfamily enzyme
MKITKIRVFELKGCNRSGIAVFEDSHPYLGKVNDGDLCYNQFFTEIETDEGITGLSLGGSRDTKLLGEILIGENPLRIEYIWERLYNARYVRFQSIQSIAVLDLVLWDLMGKLRGEPVYQLLGGPTREKVPAYAAMLGFSTEPSRAAKASIDMVKKGFRKVKWYLPCNEADGEEGFKKNIDIVKSIREAVGEDIGIILDFGIAKPDKSSLFYMIKLAKRLEQYNIDWLEEPLNFDDLESYVRLSKATTIPLACGERFYSRWQIKDLITTGAINILQPDPFFAMGMTEVRKIISLVSAYGLTVMPHANESCIHTAHLLFSNPERICPMGEFGVKLNHNFQYFYKDFYEPVDGYFQLPKGPGFGYEIDWKKVVNKEEI